MSEALYAKIASEEGFSVEDLKRGYTVFDVDGALVIQAIDCLRYYNLHKFETDHEAGLQAQLDGIAVYKVTGGEYDGWFALDTEENRKAIEN